jgi:hypothetical protein
MIAYYTICPCKDCTKREPLCHGKCKKYEAWKNSGIEIKTVYIDHTMKRRRKK